MSSEPILDRIEKRVDLAAPLDRVWRAIAEPAEFGSWFGVKLDGVFVLGETKRGPITYPGFEHVIWEATIVKIDPPRLFAFTWHPFAVDPTVDYGAETPTRVEFHLEARKEGTRLTIIESGFNSLPGDRRAKAFSMNESGWTEQIANIANHVAG